MCSYVAIFKAILVEVTLKSILGRGTLVLKPGEACILEKQKGHQWLEHNELEVRKINKSGLLQDFVDHGEDLDLY